MFVNFPPVQINPAHCARLHLWVDYQQLMRVGKFTYTIRQTPLLRSWSL